MNRYISIIVRTRNEERWISQCLSAVFSQEYKDFEVIIVDNESSDKTREKAGRFPIRDIISCRDYLPGKALNIGIKKAKGDFIVCLSGHCLPNSGGWLSSLLRNFYRESGYKELDVQVAGVYGRQKPLDFTSDSDKRDLALAFGLDRKVQARDSFFHNANSMIRKAIWEEIPFDETVTNIEDRVWAKEVLQKGYKIIYEPEAAVYHYHGIHQNGDHERCRNVVRILEDLYSADYRCKSIELEKLNIVAIIPVKGQIQYLNGEPLLAYTLERARESRYIKRIVVSTDNRELARLAEELGAEAPFIRDSSFSREYIDLVQVYQHSLGKIEGLNILPDLVVPLEITFPFRPSGLLDDMIVKLATKGLDSIVAARIENKAIWKERDNRIVMLEEGLTPRQFKEPAFVELKGLGCVTHPEFIRQGSLLGSKIGMYEISNPYSPLEVRSEEDFKMASLLMKKWRADNG